MEFKINKEYSSKTIAKNYKNIRTFGALEGGKHTIESGSLQFVMLESAAWIGTNSLYYKCTKA